MSPERAGRARRVKAALLVEPRQGCSLGRQGTQGVAPAGQSRASRTGSVSRKGTQGVASAGQSRATRTGSVGRKGTQGEGSFAGGATAGLAAWTGRARRV